jgi:hypothetical protein
MVQNFSKFFLGLAVWSSLLSFNALSAVITFGFSNRGTGTSNLSFTSGGVTITLSNYAGGTAGYQTDGDGLFISDRTTEFSSGSLLEFDVKFSSDVKILSYVVGYTQTLTSSSFNLTGGRTGAASSLNNNLTTAGSYNLSSDYILNANQNGRFAATVTGTNTRLTQLKSFTVETNVPSAPINNSVPEPGSMVVFAMGLTGWIARRRLARLA